jgi:hypothetical protein
MTYLIFALCFVPFFQPTHHRRQVAALYALAVGAMELGGPYLGDYAYYLTGGALDALVIALIARMAYSNFGAAIQYISLASLFTNALGFLTWFNYMEPTAYNHSFIAVYAVALFILVTGGPDAWRSCKTNHWLHWVPAFDRASGKYHCTLQGEETP